MQSRSHAVSLFLAAILLIFCLFFLFPLVYGIFISFTDWDGITADYQLIGIKNYIRMFQDKRFQNSVIVTIKYGLTLLSFALMLGYISAKVINNLPIFRSQMLFLSFLPYVITPVVSCILWNQMYIGLLPEIGKRFGIALLKSNLLANKDIALYAVSAVDLWMFVPYAMLLLSSALNAIPQELLEAAKLDGANSFHIASYIEFPYLLPTIGMLTTMIASRALTNIDTILVLTSGGPVRSTETLYYTIYRNSTEELHYAYGLAEGVVVSVVSILIFLLINKLVIGCRADDITYQG